MMWLEKVKNWIVQGLAFLAVPLVAVLYALQQKQKRTQDALETEKAKAELAAALTKQEEAKHVADQKAQDFEALASDYESKSGGGTGSGSGGVPAPH